MELSPPPDVMSKAGQRSREAKSWPSSETCFREFRKISLRKRNERCARTSSTSRHRRRRARRSTDSAGAGTQSAGTASSRTQTCPSSGRRSRKKRSTGRASCAGSPRRRPRTSRARTELRFLAVLRHRLRRPVQEPTRGPEPDEEDRDRVHGLVLRLREVPRVEHEAPGEVEEDAEEDEEQVQARGQSLQGRGFLRHPPRVGSSG